MFLRDGCTLPDRFDLRQEKFCQNWMLVDDLTAIALDAKIRRAGWHFMWMLGASCSLGWGTTSEAALRQALERALSKTSRQFNASELGSFIVRKYPGFIVAKVVLHPRLIQQLTSLDIANA